MISYKPLKYLLLDNDMNMQELRDNNVLNPNIAAKMNNDRGYVNLSTIDNILNYLSIKLGRIIKVDEVLEFTPDDPAETDTPIE